MSFLEFFNIRAINIQDVFDILIIWFVIYNLFRFMRGSRTMQMAFGLLALFASQILAEQFKLVVVSNIIGSLFNIIPVAIIVLFQDEIRRMLASIGSNRFFNKEAEAQTTELNNVFQAALRLSKSEIGMLVVFEREQGLREYIESGSRIDALPNTELLLDIFQPKSCLHDGAVIISNARIASAACLMPLSRNRDLPKHLGTRHRAAIGITEETDCIALVVSEETGRISFTENGAIYTLTDPNLSQLYETYSNLMLPEDHEKIESLKIFSKNALRRTRNRSQERRQKKKDKQQQDTQDKQEVSQ